MTTERFRTELPDWAKDAVYVNSEHHFSMRDRLKILFGWTVHEHCGVATEELIGRTEVHRQYLSFGRPGWWPFKPKWAGYMAVHEPDSEAKAST
jgi:hypothetical protein